MKNNLHIEQELKEIAPQLPLHQKMPFYIPKDYFTNFESTISGIIAADNLEKNGSKTMPFTLPKNYFNQFEENIIAKVKNNLSSEFNNELAEIAPTLNTISKQPVFSVPNNYFEHFQPKISNNNAKVIGIQSSKKWLYTAVAASIFAIAIVGAFIFSNTHSANNTYDFASAKNINVKQSIQQLSDEELTKYLYNEHYVSNSEFVTTDFEEIPDVQQHIKTISDEELQQYLKEEPTLKEQKKG
ncbi:MAG: hypothetical protein ACOVNY_09510 [Chitinophagaceae bacterium]